MSDQFSTLCLACGKKMEVLEPGFHYHPLCIPEFTAVPGIGMSFHDLGIKEDLIEIIRWAQNNSHRSRQVALGCSEVGHGCDRRIAYRMANVPEYNTTMDPWPAIVGTAVHQWMERALDDFQQVHGTGRWLTELEVHPSPLVRGHTDLYDVENACVLDWKFPSADNMRKMKAEGPSEQYVTQVQLYGMGQVNAGRPVKRVGIVALGRQGWLKDLWVWTTPYDPAVAQAALDRVNQVGFRLIELMEKDPPVHVYHQIPAQSSRLCTWCPWFNPNLRTATDAGCPGFKAS